MPHSLTLCSYHNQWLRMTCSDTQELADAHVIRLFIERGLSRLRATAHPEQIDTPQQRLDWIDYLYDSCARVADGCPICCDHYPNEMLSRVIRAVQETRFGLQAHEEIDLDDTALPFRIELPLVGLPPMPDGFSGALWNAAYLAPLRIGGIPIKPEMSAAGAWWN